MAQATLVETRRKAELLRKIAQLKEKCGLSFYRPHPKQEAFHRAGEFKRRYARTGNRFGKSEMGAAEDCSWAIGERLFFPKEDEARYLGLPQRPTKGCIVVADWDKATEIFTSQESGSARGKLFRMLPKDSIVRTHRNHSGAIDKVTVQSRNGGESSIWFETVKSFKQNPMGIESSNWDWIHVDEPCPEQMWKALARGLIDSGGSAWFTCTPIAEMWINRYFLPSVRDELKDDYYIDGSKKWVMFGSSFDNPYNDAEDIEDFADLLTEDEKECRLHGIPTALSGLVYKEFRPDDHVYHKPPHGWKAFDEPPKDYTIRFAIDPHPKEPHAVLFAATAPTGETFIFHEIFDKCLIGQLSEKIKSITEGRFVVKQWCDPIAWIENPVDGSSMMVEFNRNGVFVEKASKDLSYGILKTRQALKNNELYFSAMLRETLFEFDNYVWDPAKERPIDDKDHMMECLYRLVVGGLHYVEPTSYDGKVVPQRRLPTTNLAPLAYSKPTHVRRRASKFADRYPK